MTCYTEVRCKICGSKNVKIISRSAYGESRFRCYEEHCATKTFMLKYRYKAYETGVKEQAVEMAINGSGIRDTSRVLGISKSTVIGTLKAKESKLLQVNPKLNSLQLGADTSVHIDLACEIERKNLNFRTWNNRLARKTLCFSKLEKVHDIVIGLLINKLEFGVDIHAKSQG